MILKSSFLEIDSLQVEERMRGWLKCPYDFFMVRPKKFAKLQLRSKLRSLDFVQLRIRSWTKFKH